MTGQKRRRAEPPERAERRRVRNRAWVLAVLAAAVVAILMALAIGV